MNLLLRRVAALLALTAILPACGSDDDDAPLFVGPPENANLLLGGGTQLAAFATTHPAGLTTPLTLSGLNAGDVLADIDRRPVNNMLYGLGYNAGAGTVQLYLIEPGAGLCVALGIPGTFVQADGATPVPIAGTRVGIDFNPAADRLRVVTDAGQNFRLNPNTGAAVDGNLGGGAGAAPGLNMDGPLNGAAVTAQAAAYTNNNTLNPTTTLYTLEQAADAMYIQNPPNSGTQTTPVGFAAPVDFVRAFDIPRGVDVAVNNAAAAGEGFAVIRFPGQAGDSLARLDLTLGTLSSVGSFGAVTSGGMAVMEVDGLPIVALGGTNGLHRFHSDAPAATTSIAASGVIGLESLVGIDFRPQTGQLYALGVNAAADTGTLYLVDPFTGVATPIGTPGQIAFTTDGATVVDLPDPFAGAQYGFNFNPSVDRIRVVTSSGLNFRLNPDSGAPVDGNNGGGAVAGVNPDGSLNGATLGASAVAYTNNHSRDLAVTGSTTLYVLDSTTNALYIQNPPNNGTLTSPLTVTLGGVTLDFNGDAGFDISDDVRVAASNVPATGSGYAALNVGGNTGLYRINLATGAATLLGSIGTGAVPLRAITVGHRTVK